MEKINSINISPQRLNNILSSHEKISRERSFYGLYFRPDPSDYSRIHLPDHRNFEFKLQSSIVNVKKYETVHGSPISDFTKQLNTTGTKNKEKQRQKRKEKHIRSFDSRAAFIPLKKRKEIKIKMIKKKKKCNALNDLKFQSDTEDVPQFLPLDSSLRSKLSFMSKKRYLVGFSISWQNPKHIKGLKEEIMKRCVKTEDNKTYRCKYCPKEFSKKAALGGHMTKAHPKN